MKSVYLACLLSLCASTVNAQTSALQRARSALPADQAREFDGVVADIRKRGLPIEPLADKVLEGSAKGVPPARIMTVVRQRAGHLRSAAAVIGNTRGVRTNEITTIADAFQRGIKDDEARALKNGSRAGEPLGLALHTLADLRDRGVPTDVALDVIAAWRTRGGKPAELRDLPANVERLIRQGAKPEQAGSAVAETVRSGRSPGRARVDSNEQQRSSNSGKGRNAAPGQQRRNRGNGGG